MCNRMQEEETSNVNLFASGFVLTPLACSLLINEIIKSLLYQRSQIPFTYNWLKNLVLKKRKFIAENNDEQAIKTNFTAKKYYDIISKAYDVMEEIMENLSMEFKNKSCVVHEILIIFGVTPYNPKQSILIKLTNFAHNHAEVNHIQINFKKQQNILRNLFLSDEWMKVTDSQASLTNMYIMLKKTDATSTNNDKFTLVRDFNRPAKNCICIQLRCDRSDNLSCCNNLPIFDDKVQADTAKIEDDEIVEKDSSCDGLWYQMNVHFKGFKDCYINKIHASELW